MRGSLEARFWAKVERRGPDECWPWKDALRVRPGGSRETIKAIRGRYTWANVA